jgi:hypothetical protein
VGIKREVAMIQIRVQALSKIICSFSGVIRVERLFQMVLSRWLDPFMRVGKENVGGTL